MFTQELSTLINHTFCKVTKYREFFSFLEIKPFNNIPIKDNQNISLKSNIKSSQCDANHMGLFPLLPEVNNIHDF